MPLSVNFFIAYYMSPSLVCDGLQKLTRVHMLKRSFSFIEILIVFVLLASISAIAGIKVFQSIDSARFTTSARLLEEKIKTVKKLARLTQGAIKVSLTKDDFNNVACSFSGERIPVALKQVFSLSDTLKGIFDIGLDGKNMTQTLDTSICLYIQPPGNITDHNLKKIEVDTLDIIPNAPNGKHHIIQLDNTATIQVQTDALYPQEISAKVEKAKKLSPP